MSVALPLRLNMTMLNCLNFYVNKFALNLLSSFRL